VGRRMGYDEGVATSGGITRSPGGSEIWIGREGGDDMIAASLSILILLGLAAGPDAEALIARLGSSRYAEREEAAAALAKIGRDALPALKKAVDSRDPEVRARASALIDRIDSELLTRPTRVTLDFQDRPLDEIARALSERCGVAILLEPEDAPMWKE